VVEIMRNSFILCKLAICFTLLQSDELRKLMTDLEEDFEIIRELEE